MIALKQLPLPAVCVAGAAAVGLLFGVLVGFLPQESGNYTVNDEWTAFPELAPSSVESIEAALLASPQWQAVDASAPLENEEVEDSDRPAVLASMRVVAIVVEPESSALLYVRDVPDSLEEGLLLIPDSNGLVKVHPGDEVAQGWKVLDISPTGVTIAGVPGQGKEGSDEQGPETVRYKLYEWK